VDTVIVDDDELRAGFDRRDAVLGRAVSDLYPSVHDGAKQIGAPRRIHDRHRTHDQHPPDGSDGQQVVGSPRHGHRLSRPLLGEAITLVVCCQEPGGVLLMVERPEHPRPVVIPRDRVRNIPYLHVAQDAGFLPPPMHQHLRHITVAPQDSGLRDAVRDEIRLACAEFQRLVLYDFHPYPKRK